MSISAISRRYAKALVDLGAEQKMVGRYAEELATVGSLLEREELLRLILESPSFPQEKKSTILADVIASMKLSAGMAKFLGLLLAKDRLRYLPQIQGNYRAFADELSGVLRARLSSASELAPEQRQAIQKDLEKQTGKKVELTVDIDPALIGGLKAEFGGKVFDGSIRTQLKRIEDTLKKG
ncbi:ATP synthase subunit delta [Desulfuromonas versatilis]|uniref:ATP synthase subunit delta n=1 Tax=Desulfuromonas versatilis TaxID=2802975 RepID=A0ABN6DRR7_9BACT|nr:ATP synthase F1 subunit delta [Desulfuromonas versatilis]BCR02953.1 ATP synthase subunit delta [Desulfuromonas versatilis]